MSPSPGSVFTSLWQRFNSLSPWRAGLLTALGCLACCALLASPLLETYRQRVLATAEARLTATSLAAASSVRRDLDALDLLVSIAVQELAQGQFSIARVYQRLSSSIIAYDKGTSSRNVIITNGEGRVRLTSVITGSSFDLSDREYFRVHLENRASGMAIGHPLTARAWPYSRIVPVSWPLRSATGQLVGVVMVRANVDLYARMFADLLADSEETIALVDGSGELYALDARHWPRVDVAPPRPPGLDEWLRSGTAAAGDMKLAEHVVSVTEVGELDLWVVAAKPAAALLAEWRMQVAIAIAASFAFSLIAGWITFVRQQNIALLRTTLGQAEAAATQARLAQAKAEESERAKAQFLAAMSHEIRTPLTGVLGMADVLASEPLGPRQQNYVRSIRVSGQHLLGVINDILDFSRLEAGGLHPDEVDFSLTTVIVQVQSIMTPQAVEHGLTLDFDPDPQLPPVVQGDPARLRQILVNLIGNGLKFTSQGGVRVTIRRCDGAARDWFRFEIRDTGIGIDPERLKGLFHAFTQADRSIARRYGGTGLGLAICQHLVQLMGGRIGGESRPGQGSLFWFELRLPEGDRSLAEQQADPDPTSCPPLRILVAEDVELNRDLLLAILTKGGHSITFTQNGREAVEKAAAEVFDIVLMDVQMPEMDGIEATQRIRRLPAPHGSVAIVALTANVMDTERRRCLNAGMNDVLTKPIAWGELYRTLAGICRPAAPTGDAPAPAVPAAPDDSLAAGPLLDHTRIAALTKMAGPVRAAKFLHDALVSARELVAEIQRLKDDPAEVAKPAHRLAGTAPSFGLLRIGILARAIEQEALAGRQIEHLVGELQIVCEATAQKLARHAPEAEKA
ncbi:MAG TPA: ATP-binding protein [Geminicoccus sp.]|uniref:ATP-binding protein n=1 Tax=Geminicoccus sp. TaxID=2024832 RepID=UPI002C6C9779|nr:ATP-binding protein [Geminicoccus sp.]HWL69149.1 ATP-binding protein [Geminicoccus sp.]